MMENEQKLVESGSWIKKSSIKFAFITHFNEFSVLSYDDEILQKIFRHFHLTTLPHNKAA